MKPFVQLRIESGAFEADSVQVAEMSGRERISRLFEIELRILTLDGSLDEDKLLTTGVVLIFERKTSDSGPATELRRIPGIVCSILDRALSETSHREYIVTVVPRAWQASLTSTSDICMDMKVPDILQKKLMQAAGLVANTDVELRLMGTYKPQEFIVQYKETSLDFVCRLAEDLGIHFFFEEVGGRDVLVFGDDNSAFKPALPATSPFSQRGDRVEVYELEARRKLVTKNFVARDYNYRNPSLDVHGQAQVPALGLGSVDEYGPHAKTAAEATTYATVRAEEANAESLTFEGKSDLAGLRAGSILTVEGHPRGDLDIVVIEVVHALTQPVFGVPPKKDRPYANTFRAIPKNVTYRPPRLTPKPVVAGVLTGIVESEAPTSLGAVDDQGRYKVAFMYDAVADRADGKASRPLRMAQPSAGDSRGFHQPLKTGTEVIISCVNGDPDRPIISGAVPNPQTPSPVSSSNSEKSMWVTNKNSMVFDDTLARMKTSISGDAHVFQMGEPDAPETGIMIGTVGNVSTVANGDDTDSSKKKSVYVDDLMTLSAKNIVLAAGIPNPLSLWNKVEEAAQKVADYVKEATDFVDDFKNKYDDQLAAAKADAQEATDALAKATKQAQKDLKVDKKTKPKAILDPSGKMREETPEEAKQRTFKEQLHEHPEVKRDLAYAVDNKLAADKALAAYEAPVQDAEDEANKIAKDGVAAVKQMGKAGKDLADGKIVKGAEELPFIGNSVKKALDQVDNLKEIEAAVKKMPAAKKLFSALAKVFSTAAEEAFDATVKASQEAAHGIPTAGGERNSASVGTFGKPFNIQLSKNSASLYGAKDAFMFGGLNATVASKSTSILGAKRVDVKARSLVELAAKLIMITGSKIVDVHASKDLKLVAHPGDKDIDMPGGNTMYLHSKEGILLDSVDKDIGVTAKKNIILQAQEENIELTAKKTFKVTASENDVQVTSAKGKVDIMANKGQTSVRSKEKLVLQTMDNDFTLVSDKGAGTVQASKALTLSCQSGEWTAKKEVEVNAKKLTVNGKFTVNGSKVELG